MKQTHLPRICIKYGRKPSSRIKTQGDTTGWGKILPLIPGEPGSLGSGGALGSAAWSPPPPRWLAAFRHALGPLGSQRSRRLMAPAWGRGRGVLP
jgi:hypothetical protein